MSDDLPTPTPPVNPETELFWEATADETLLLKRCTDCGNTHYYPRAQCPNCFSDDTEWFEAGGEGTIYTYTVVRQTMGTYGNATPYVLAYVKLDEGTRLMTNVVGVDSFDALEIGQEVTVVFDETEGDEDAKLPRFTPK